MYRASTIGNEICSSQAILQTIEVVCSRKLSDGEMQTGAGLENGCKLLAL